MTARLTLEDRPLNQGGVAESPKGGVRKQPGAGTCPVAVPKGWGEVTPTHQIGQYARAALRQGAVSSLCPTSGGDWCCLTFTSGLCLGSLPLCLPDGFVKDNGLWGLKASELTWRKMRFLDAKTMFDESLYPSNFLSFSSFLPSIPSPTPPTVSPFPISFLSLLPYIPPPRSPSSRPSHSFLLSFLLLSYTWLSKNSPGRQLSAKKVDVVTQQGPGMWGSCQGELLAFGTVAAPFLLL